MRINILAMTFLLAAMPAVAQDATARQITVTGEGQVDSAPDMAMVSLGVVTEGKTAPEALDANSAAMQAVMARVEAAGIAARDVQTSVLDLSPRWADPVEGQNRPRIDGYVASNRLTVRVRDLPALGSVLSAAVADGANSFDGLSFGLQEPQPAEDEARRAAVADALRKAQLLAEAAGATLGQVMSISEQGDIPRPMMMEQAAFARDASVPVAPGEITLRATVTMVYALN